MSSLLSSSYNLSTAFVAADASPEQIKQLRRLQSEIEKNQHQGTKIGATRQTREWYKDKMKVEVLPRCCPGVSLCGHVW